MSSEMYKWAYDGEVLRFGQYVGNFKGVTMAPTEKKAMSNFKYQYAKKVGYSAQSQFTLIAKPVRIG